MDRGKNMDTVTSSQTLKIEHLFFDGDTRTQTINIPKQGLTEADIKSYETLILNGGTSTILIGDKAGADYRRINYAKYVTTTTTTLDIS